jgi:prepilin-type N-terminal cleavage/methylation domain-containing protein
MNADKPIDVPGRWRAAAGFTLLEVMIAIGIMATILVILFGTYSAAVDRLRARDLSQVYHEARVLLQLMVNDLRSAYVKEPTQQAQQALQQAKTEPITFLGRIARKLIIRRISWHLPPFCRLNAPMFLIRRCAM